MKVEKINTSTSFGNAQKQETFLEKFHSHTKNAADMSDTVVVPRTIFKGYLGIMAGTTLTALSGLAKNIHLKKALNVTGLLTCLYGTWAFVRPFVVKDAPGVEKTK